MPSVAEDPVEESSNRIQSGRKCWKSLKSKEDFNRISIKKIISLIRLALMINDDDIFLSDILRLILFTFKFKLIELLNNHDVLYPVLFKI